MSRYRQQAYIEAPVEDVWELVGTPRRHSEWWPRVIEVRGERFEEGDEYAQVTKDPGGRHVRTEFLVERRQDLREVRLLCQHTGMYADWLLTAAQGGTFVELEMGLQPRGVGNRVWDLAMGHIYFRRWAGQSLDGLREALASSVPASDPEAG